MNVPFDFVDAKLRGRRRKLYEGDRLEEVAHSRNVGELAETIFPEEPPETPKRLQKRLDQQALHEMVQFLPYLDEAHSYLLRTLLSRYQVWNLKIALRLFGRETAAEQADRFMLDLPPSLALPREKLLNASDVDEFLRAVPQETLRESTAPALKTYEETNRRAFLEMGLDRGWWQCVEEALNRLYYWKGQRCLPALEAERRCRGVLTVLRAARTYNVNWSTLAPLMPALPGADDEEDAFRRLHEEPDAQTVADVLARISNLSIQPDEAQHLPELEDTLWTHVVKTANQQFYTALQSPGTLVAYTYLKRAECRKLVSLAEMLWRDVPPDKRVERLQPLTFRRGGG